MSLWCVRLDFFDRVHFGSLGVGLESAESSLHSDSLYSALCHAWSACFGSEDVTDLVKKFQTDPPFLFSSAFPFLEDVFFLPKPMVSPPGFEQPEVRLEYGKEVKKADYLTREHFSAWLEGKSVAFAEMGRTNELLSKVYHRELVPRVALGRENNRSEIFHVGVLRFSEGAGLYFLVRLNDERWLPRLSASLALLGEMGLGGERTYGLGRFAVQITRTDSSWDFLDTEVRGRALTLSLFCPEEADIDLIDETSSYGLIERKGWIHSPLTYRQLKRRSIVMFTEGSVFTHRLKGQMLNVTPTAWDVTRTHPIYRFAFPFFVHAG